MRFHSFAVGLIAVAIMASSACAHPAASSDLTPKVAHIDPPTMIHGDTPNFRSPAPFDVKISVMIKANGEPDMQTLLIRGVVGGGTRQELTDWIEQSAFRPAQKDGMPVAALFTMGLQLRR
jgi:hypothetical protein